MDLVTRDNDLKTNNMVKGRKSDKMGRSMKGNFKMEPKLEKENLFGRMDQAMKEIL